MSWKMLEQQFDDAMWISDVERRAHRSDFNSPKAIVTDLLPELY